MSTGPLRRWDVDTHFSSLVGGGGKVEGCVYQHPYAHAVGGHPSKLPPGRDYKLARVWPTPRLNRSSGHDVHGGRQGWAGPPHPLMDANTVVSCPEGRSRRSRPKSTPIFPRATPGPQWEEMCDVETQSHIPRLTEAPVHEPQRREQPTLPGGRNRKTKIHK